MEKQKDNLFNSSFERYDKFESVSYDVTKWEHVYKRKGMQLRLRPSSIGNNEVLAFKYMPYSRLIQSINENKFVFVSPQKWRDPFETLFYSENTPIDDAEINVRAACFALNDFENEEALWHFSPFSSDSADNPTVRVAFKMRSLYDELEKYASNNEGVDFYISTVEYEESNEILKLSERYSPNNLDDYIEQLCLKRKAYEHEIELRLFLVSKVPMGDNEDIYKVKIDNFPGIISSVTLPPCDPMIKGKHLCPECYHNVLIHSYKEIYDNLMNMGIDVEYSHIYDIYYHKQRTSKCTK